MANPYRVLGIEQGAGDGEIRSRYHDLLRRFPPEREPAAFERIQKAYASVRDLRSRLELLLFDPSQGESIGEWIEEIRAEAGERRLGLGAIREMFKP